MSATASNAGVRVYPLAAIFAMALSVRLACAFLLLPAVPGSFSPVHPDTWTYLDAFTNLVTQGRYCFDLEIRDSCFYRLPTYPFFLGLHWLAAPEWMATAVTWSQATLDAFTCCMAVALARHLALAPAAVNLVAAVFVFNPLTLFWIPVQMPEVLGVFLTVGATYLSVRHASDVKWLAVAAALAVLAVWTKQYLAALLPAVGLFLLGNARRGTRLRQFVLFGALFGALYSPWVIRNYVNYGEFIPLSGKTTGARHFLADYTAAMAFYSLFHVNYNKQIREVIHTGATRLPPSNFVSRNKEAIDAAAALAHQCGPSFRAWRRESVVMDGAARACERDVAAAYRALIRTARADLGPWEFNRTRVLGMVKALTKYDLDLRQRSSLIQAPIFLVRFVAILLAFGAVFAAATVQQRVFAWGANLFWLSTAGVLAFALRHVEMRYLLMADTLMIIAAGITISSLSAHLRRGRRSQLVPATSGLQGPH